MPQGGLGAHLTFFTSHCGLGVPSSEGSLGYFLLVGGASLLTEGCSFPAGNVLLRSRGGYSPPSTAVGVVRSSPQTFSNRARSSSSRKLVLREANLH